ncbi:6-phospho-3-hexuloisomerase [Terriglobus tenax]|uniref:6-phospho-3-hexuloisomerase n=1 Tax=Terriglobus tenax TaxID=1111115 RepID=UPI0021DFD2B8|nr:6-phospho-3-hexuloisomerase [Terriglobus tenax]
MQAAATASASFASLQNTILAEVQQTLSTIREEQIEQATQMILAARRVFLTGAGRSGLALRMAAMRLMHLGLTVHFAGEVTAPAIATGDLLIVASGSGTTASAVHAAEVARKNNAQVLCYTTSPESPLARLAQGVIVIPAQTKQDHAGVRSAQYSGALFEQSVLLASDAIFQMLWQASGKSAEDLWSRHANLE